MLQPTENYAYVEDGVLADPATSALRINGQTPTSQYFKRPTTVGATSIGVSTPDAELAENWGIYRIWIDEGGVAPDADHTSQQGELIVNEQGLRVERTDYWRAHTPAEITSLRVDMRRALKAHMVSVYAQVSEHLGSGEDGPAIARDILQASRDIAEATALNAVDALADWFRDQHGYAIPAFSRDGADGTIRVNLKAADFETEFRKQIKLSQMEDRREIFITVRNEINALTLYSELAAYDYAARVDELLAALP